MERMLKMPKTHNNKKKKRFNLYNLAKDGKGVRKEDVIRDLNFINFFKLYARRFSSIVAVNLFIIFGNFPIWFGLLGVSGNVGMESRLHTNVLYPLLRGVMSGGTTPVSAALYGAIGQRQVHYVLNTAAYVLIGLSALTIFTYGIVNAATAYVLRNMVKCDPLFLPQDFFYAIRRNWKQALPFGVIDVLLSALLVYDIVFFYYNATSFLRSAMFFLAVALGIIYFVMRYYLYLMMVTFSLSIGKLLKNAFIFAMINFRRNLVGTIGIVAAVALCFYLTYVFLPLGTVVLLFLLLGSCAFIATYTAWPKIKSVMIDPYYRETASEDTGAVYAEQE